MLHTGASQRRANARRASAVNPPRSARLTYRPPQDTDRPFLRALGEATGVREFIGGLSMPTQERDADLILFVISDNQTPIGLGGFVRSDTSESGDFELVCSVLPIARCRGFASEACEALVLWVWTARPWPRVLACVNRANHPGMAVARKLGFIEVGPRLSDANVLILERARPAGGAAHEGDEG
jgi:RimJ/RimL family protein N-acetyltransferase